MTVYSLLVAAIVLFLLGFFYSSVFIVPAVIVGIIGVVLAVTSGRGRTRL